MIRKGALDLINNGHVPGGAHEIKRRSNAQQIGNAQHASLQFIGHLQTNKVRQIVGKVDLIQSVDSVKLAKEISRQSEKLGITTDILLEVNIGREANKSGVMPEALYE